MSNILIVDEKYLVTTLLAEMLQKEGHSVTIYEPKSTDSEPLKLLQSALQQSKWDMIIIETLWYPKRELPELQQILDATKAVIVGLTWFKKCPIKVDFENSKPYKFRTVMPTILDLLKK